MLVDGTQYTAAISAAVTHSRGILGGYRLGNQACFPAVIEYLNGYLNGDFPPHLLVKVVLTHGAEHKAGFQGFPTPFVHDLGSFSANTFCHHN
jgi:hypothetical protein